MHLTLTTFKDLAIIPEDYMTSSPSTNPSSNIALGNHPFIWGNIALLAGVPWLLVLSMAGLAVGDPVFPAWFEIFLLGFPAIALVTWLHWQQPIFPFSLWFIAKPSESLSEPERQILTLVKQQRNGWYVTGWIAAVVAIAMSAIFCKIYLAAPLAQVIAPFPASLRLFGIIWAEIFFLLSNILAQAGISALRIKLTAESDLKGLQPFAVEKIKNSFTTIGWRSPQLLKFFEEDAIGEVTNDLPQSEIAREVADETTDQHSDVKESQEQETEEAEPSNIVSEVGLEVVPEINTLVENVSETETIADTTEDAIAESVETTLDSEPTEIASKTQIETILDEELVQESEELEASKLVAEPEFVTSLDIAEPVIAEPAIDEPEPSSEISDISLDAQLIEESEELEISEIAAEESVLEAVSEPETEQFFEEPQIESVLNQELDQEVVEESELDPIEISEESEVEESLITEATSETEIEESATIEESEELEISAIANEEPVLETIAETEEELNPFESIDAFGDDEVSVETGLENIDTTSEAVIEDPEIENINCINEELVAFETEEDPELTFLEIPDTSPETNFEEPEQAEASLDPADTFLDEQLAEDNEELESLETVEDSDIEVVENTATTNDDKRGLDFFKRSRKTGGSPKKYGFGKAIKRDHLPVPSQEVFEPDDIKAPDADIEVSITKDDLNISDPNLEPEIINELDQETNIEFSIEPELETIDSKTQDFDDELDELIAFNTYVENILKEYLEDNEEEFESVDNNVETAEIVEATAGLKIEGNIDLSLVDGESLDAESAEPIDPSIVFDPTQEAIMLAQENVEAFTENLPELATQVSEDISEEINEEIDSNDQETKDSKYLVQESLVDQFLARLEELNNADKANKEKEQASETLTELNTENIEIDEFADLEALLDRSPLQENNNDID